MVTVEVLCAILQFAVFRFVQVFNDLDAAGFGVFEMPLDIFEEYGQPLCHKTKLLRDSALAPHSIQHEPRASDTHLRTANWVAVAVMLNKAERLARQAIAS